MYNGYGMAINGAGSWSFSNDFPRNVIIFCIDNSSSSHTDNCKNNFQSKVRPTDNINGSINTAEKTFSINFSKAKTKFCLSLHYNSDSSYLFVNIKKIYKFIADNENVNSPSQFCLGSISERFGRNASKEVFLKEMCVIFQSIAMLFINMKL